VTSTLNLTNTILVSHTLGVTVAQGASIVLEATLWGQGVWANQRDWGGSGTIITGTHNHWDEPGFVDPEGLDYHLDAASLAVDQGVNTALVTDVDNQPRPEPGTGVPDLGADEYWALIPITAVSITGPVTATAYAPAMFTATVTPITATPNLLYFWLPEPDAGQWTAMADYVWTKAGAETVTVKAIQAGRVVTGTYQIEVKPAIFKVYMPNILR